MTFDLDLTQVVSMSGSDPGKQGVIFQYICLLNTYLPKTYNISSAALMLGVQRS